MRQAFGDQGPGLDVALEQMEDGAGAAARGLTAGALDEATTQQAQALGTEQPCPACGQVCPITHAERPIHARWPRYDPTITPAPPPSTPKRSYRQ